MKASQEEDKKKHASYLFFNLLGISYALAMIVCGVNGRGDIAFYLTIPLLILLGIVIGILMIHNKSEKSKFITGLKNKTNTKTELRDRVYTGILLNSTFKSQVTARLPYTLKQVSFSYEIPLFSFSGEWGENTVGLNIDDEGADIVFNEETDHDVYISIPFACFDKTSTVEFFELLYECLSQIKSREEYEKAIKAKGCDKIS